MKTPLVQWTLLERVLLCIIALFLLKVIPWTFQNIASWYFGGAICGFLALTSKRRIGLALGSAAAIACLITAIVSTTVWTQPLRTKISGTNFAATPLTNVLQYLANQKQNWPSWRFFIYNTNLPATEVTVDLPKSCTLGDALEQIGASAKCDFSYSWFASCGNAASPSCARFAVREHGSRSGNESSPSVFITRTVIHTR
jgi:hypothetical protein